MGGDHVSKERAANKQLAIGLLVEELPSLRAKISISQEELSGYIGVSRQTISAIELRKKPCTWSVFMSLVLFFTLQEKTNKALKLIPGFTDALKNCLNYDNSL